MAGGWCAGIVVWVPFPGQLSFGAQGEANIAILGAHCVVCVCVCARGLVCLACGVCVCGVVCVRLFGN